MNRAGGLRRFSRRGWKIVAVHLVAVVVAAGLAVVDIGISGVYGANHCTRYAPTVSQDFNCQQTGGLQASQSCCRYSTPSVALRDSNSIYVTASNTYWLRYDGGNNDSYFGQGTGFSTGGSGGYAKAQCDVLYGAQGVCWTNWHD